MSFIYRRTVRVYRPTTTTDVGDRGYSAQRGWNDTDAVLSNLPASIQLDRQGQRNPVGLPADAAYKPIWKIYIPRRAANVGDILSTDVIVDDTGIAYQVFAPYWNSLGFQCRAIVLEV